MNTLLRENAAATRIGLIAAMLAVALGSGIVACLHEEERAVTYENGSDVVLKVMIDDFDLTTLQPGESKAFQRRKNLLPDRIRAFDQNGNLRFDEVVTWEDLEAGEFRVLIR